MSLLDSLITHLHLQEQKGKKFAKSSVFFILNLCSMSLMKELKSNVKDDGSHHLKVQFFGAPTFPQSIILNATSEVTDLNAQQIKTETQFFLHPCPYYIGMKAPTHIKDSELQLTLVVADIGKFHQSCL